MTNRDATLENNSTGQIVDPAAMHRPNPELTQAVTTLITNWLDQPEIPLHQSRNPELPNLLGEEGNPLEVVLEAFTSQVVPNNANTGSPQFFAYIPTAPTVAAAAFDALVSSMSACGSLWVESAGYITAENHAIAALTQRFGMPEGSHGVFVQGGTAGNLAGLMVARDVARTNAPIKRVAMSDEAHSSIGNALRVLGMQPLLIPVPDHRLTAELVQAAIAQDPDPDSIVAVVASAGTTNAGIIDDLAGIGAFARERGIWFHIDGAYGGGAIMSERVRPRFAGIELADSLVVDPHKWLFTPYDCGAVLYRNPTLAPASHSQKAVYLDASRLVEELNPSDFAFHLTRKARGLGLWFSLAVHGFAQYGAAVDAVIELTEYAAEQIKAHPQLDLLREPTLSVLLFRRHGWNEDDYNAWAERISDIAFVAASKWEGETVGRLVFLSPLTTREMVDAVLDTL